MSQPQPRILTSLTVPVGGYQLQFKVTNVSSRDTTLIALIAAGEYYVAWDQQDDDFIRTVAVAINDATFASPLALRAVAIDIVNIPGVASFNHRVRIGFEDNYFVGPKNDVEINWTVLDGPAVAGILGFDPTTDDVNTINDNPVFQGDSQHAYGWFADEDGLLGNDLREDSDHPTVFQSKTPSGHVKSHFVDSSFENMLMLQFLPLIKTWSADIGYTEASVTPYARNVPLQCWWKEARQGIKFRVYRDGSSEQPSRAVERGEATSGTNNTLVDTNKTWETDPPEWGRRQLLVVENWATNTLQNMRWLINPVHGVNSLSVVNIAEPVRPVNNDPTYAIFNQGYETYWLELSRQASFEPFEIPKIDRYNFTLNLLRVKV